MVAAQQLYCILAGHYLIASGLQLIQIQCRDLFECQNAAADSQQGEQAGAAQEGKPFIWGIASGESMLLGVHAGQRVPAGDH
ncbi:hypothetical protein ULF88_25555 [Halopseudomonas pachastrellae]|nr:hypothetical protein [Halopseudomonas pachastrellae]